MQVGLRNETFNIAIGLVLTLKGFVKVLTNHIMSMILPNHTVTVQVGAGLVADSEPEKE